METKKRFGLFIYDGKGGGKSAYYDHLEDVIDHMKKLLNDDMGMMSQFNVEDNGVDITMFVVGYLEVWKRENLLVVRAYKNLDYSEGCDIISCDMCGQRMVVPSWAEICPDCGYVGIDSVKEGLTLEDVEKNYIVVWEDEAKYMGEV